MKAILFHPRLQMPHPLHLVKFVNNFVRSFLFLLKVQPMDTANIEFFDLGKEPINRENFAIGEHKGQKKGFEISASQFCAFIFIPPQSSADGYDFVSFLFVCLLHDWRA